MPLCDAESHTSTEPTFFRRAHLAGAGWGQQYCCHASADSAHAPSLVWQGGAPGTPGARSGENAMRSRSAAAMASSAGARTGAGRRGGAARARLRLTSTGVRIRLRARRCPASSGPRLGKR